MQLTPTLKFGIYGLGEINQLTIYNKFKSGVNGWRFRPNWSEFETTRGQFNNTVIRNRILTVVADGKFVTLGEMPGPDPNTPEYLYGSPDAVPRIYTDRGVYPYGDADSYKDRLRNMWGALKAAINTLDVNTELPYVVAIQIAELSTGDPGTTKGTISKVTILGVQQPNPTSYNITDSDWSAIKRAELWPYAVQQMPGTAKPYFNVSNDGANFEYIRNLYPWAWIKFGYPTHNYGIPGEVFQQAMCDATKYAAFSEARIEAEFDAVNKLAWYQLNPKRNLRSIIVSACAHGMDIMNISLGDMNSVFGSDLTLMNWANRYYGFRLPAETTQGFSVFRKCIDLANVNDFPEDNVNKPVIDPALLSTYTKEVQRIQANTALSPTQKNYTITKSKISYLNPARIAALRAKFPDASYLTPDQDQDHDAYNQDFGVDMIPGNYEKFVYILNPTTLKYYWRIGPEDSYYGRFGAGFDLPNNVKRIDAYEGLTRAGNFQVNILVRYLGKGNGSFSLKYYNGTAEATAGLVTVTNTNVWAEKSFAIPNYDGGRQLTNGAGFAIVYESGAADFVVFDAVEFEVVAMNNPTNLPPTANAGTDSAITAPANSVTLTGLGADTDGTIVGYFWQKIDGPTGGNISNPTAQNTTFTGLVPGDYVVQLTVTDDKGATGSDTVGVKVNPGAPIANAGNSQTINQPTSGVTVNGSGSSAISGTITGYLWQQISGPSSSISTPTGASTTILNMSLAGVYIYQLTVTNSYGLTNSATVTITVNSAPPVNTPPVSIPGANQILTGASSTTLNGSGTDADGTIVGYLWQKISGPSGGNISSPNTASTGITALGVGTYVFQLTVTDNLGATNSKSLSVTNNAATNLPPVSVPGVNQKIQLPTTLAHVNGSASFDPDGAIAAVLWDQRKGPLTAVIASPSTLATDISGLTEPGDYVFRLRVQDNSGNVTGATLTITVIPPNNPPYVEILTPDTTLQLPTAFIDISANVSDNDGTVTTILWAQVTGDAATIESPSSPDTRISGLQAGINRFRLSAADDLGAINSKDIVIVVNPAEVEEDYVKGSTITDLTSYTVDNGINALKTLTFRVNDDYRSPVKARAGIALQYVDSGSQTFYVNCIRCTNRAKRVLTVKKGNTGLVKTVSVDIKDFKFGAALDKGSDFTIEGAEGTNFKLVSFVNNDLLT